MTNDGAVSRIHHRMDRMYIRKKRRPQGLNVTSVACNLRTCAVCRLHGAKYAVCRLNGTQSADCMVTVQTKDPSKTCDSFSKF